MPLSESPSPGAPEPFCTAKPAAQLWQSLAHWGPACLWSANGGDDQVCSQGLVVKQQAQSQHFTPRWTEVILAAPRLGLPGWASCAV